MQMKLLVGKKLLKAFSFRTFELLYFNNFPMGLSFTPQ